MIPAYSSIYALGHRAVKDIFQTGVVLEEKIDGSQFSFGVYEEAGTSVLRIRSKGAEVRLDDEHSMFKLGVATVQNIQHLLVTGYTYRGEFLAKPKHNTLAYERVPLGNIILFDIDRGNQDYMNLSEKYQEATRLGLELVPCVHYGVMINPEGIKAFLERQSCLGGVKIEGVVIKNYTMFAQDKKTLMAKFVSEAFKEHHAGEWKKANPTQSDFISVLCDSLRTEARWQKAVQHLREAGKLQDAPEDIGSLMKEVPADIEKELGDDLKERLWQHFRGQLLRGSTKGLPEWYKEQLLNKQFEARD